MYDLKSITVFARKRGKQRVILDANLLILLFVGLLDPDHIQNCKWLVEKSSFTKEDFFLLLKILENFEAEIIITPHVLTELSNMSRRGMDLGDKKQAYFNIMVEKLKNFHEEHISLSELLGKDLVHIIKFGFSDLGIIETARKLKAIILSNDAKMIIHARNQVPWAINFTNIKTASTGF